VVTKLSINLFIYESCPNHEKIEDVLFMQIQILNLLRAFSKRPTCVVMFESVVVVEAGHRGVVLYVGAVENRVLGERIHFIIPFAEQVVQMEVRALKSEANATAASTTTSSIALNYHISPSQANIIYQQLGADYADRIIAPTIQESVKASVAKFNAEELLQKP
jgi:regulator of protease activity HflC (stomatin/prohibitin superfamily)